MVLYLTSTYTRFVSVSALHQHHRLLSDAPVYQPSVIELFPDAAARLWNTLPLNVTSAFVNICFQETFDDPSLQSFFPESPVVPVHSDTNRSFYLLTYLLTYDWWSIKTCHNYVCDLRTASNFIFRWQGRVQVSATGWNRAKDRQLLICLRTSYIVWVIERRSSCAELSRSPCIVAETPLRRAFSTASLYAVATRYLVSSWQCCLRHIRSVSLTQSLTRNARRSRDDAEASYHTRDYEKCIQDIARGGAILRRWGDIESWDSVREKDRKKGGERRW